LWTQNSRGSYQDRTVKAGVSSARGTGFGAALFDLDCDGDLSLAIARGRISRRADSNASPDQKFWEPYSESNHLLLNDGSGNFSDVSSSAGDMTSPPAVARGLAVGDLDNDGRLDMVITNIAEPPRILRNMVRNDNHWLLLRAVDPA